MASVGLALAQAPLYGLDGKGEARVISVSVSRPSLTAAIFCDAIGRYLGGFSRFPIGLAAGPAAPEGPAFLAAVVDKKDEAGAVAYPRTVQKFTDTALV